MREQEEAMNDAYSLQQAALDHFYQEKKADVSSEAYTDGEFNPRSRMGMYVGIREMMTFYLKLVHGMWVRAEERTQPCLLPKRYDLRFIRLRNHDLVHARQT